MSIWINVLFIIAALSGTVEERKTTLFLVGDSTMADKVYSPSNPEKGWGQVFPLYLTEEIMVQNHAHNGRSSKSFRDEGRWAKVIDQVQKGDYVIIQFGHNDQKHEDPKRYSDPETYKENLRQYILEVQEKGGQPVLATSIARRSYDEEGNLEDTHRDYVPQVISLANEMNLPLLDLNKRTTELINEWGREASKLLFLHFKPGQYDKFPNGVEDNTHLSPIGAFKVSDLVVEEISKTLPQFSKYFKK